MYNNYPFWDCVKAADKLIKSGANVYQKFTCVGCGNRLTIDTPNKFHKLGTCDNCNATTNIEETGCNYMIHYGAKS